VGHLVELAPADAYDERFAKWRLEDLPILPDRWRFVSRGDKKKQLDILRRLMNDKDTESVICATDAGREGQLIFQLVYDYCKCRKPVQRLWISSMEDTAIREGFANLRPGAAYDRLYRAALCRSQADWLVGINATRLFSCLYGGVTLNVGRVQTPTLAMIVAREAEIAAFVTKPFYTPEIDTGRFTASGERLTDAESAGAVRAACDGRDAVVRSAERQEKTAAPPRLYDLTTLQREANRLFGFTAQQTLDYTQSLYEKKLVTYPRTDSRFLTDDMRGTAGSVINWLQVNMSFAKGVAFTPDMTRITDNSKVSDHHAVIPTMEAARADLAALPTGELDVFNLIAVRLLCATAPAHTFETVTAVLECEGLSRSGSHNFTAKGKTILRGGWKAIEDAFRATLKNKPEDAADDDKTLPDLTEGQAFPSVTASVREGRTKPPARYTEDSLLAAMEAAGSDEKYPAEKRGLGTPATRAAVIEKLVKSGVVERKKKQLHPTVKATNLIAVLPDVLTSPALTAEWEEKLGQIEADELSDSDFMGSIAAMTRELVAAHTAPDAEHAALFARKPEGEVVGLCPRCDGSVYENKKGFCCEHRACGFALWKDNRFFAAKRKALDKKTAAALLSEGRVFFSDLYSEKTGKTYGAAILLEDTGKYANFKLEFDGRKGK